MNLRDCEHGNLKRKCSICDLEDRVRELEAALRDDSQAASLAHITKSAEYLCATLEANGDAGIVYDVEIEKVRTAIKNSHIGSSVAVESRASRLEEALRELVAKLAAFSWSEEDLEQARAALRGEEEKP